MDVNLVDLFVDIAEASSLSEAARRAGVTRSHISQRLQKLERQLGAQLMRRTTRRLELTEAGHTLYEHGLRIRGEAEAARAAIGSLGRETRGLVRISLPTGLGRMLVAPLLLGFQRDHPGVMLSVRFSNRIDNLVSAQVDIALKVATSLPDELVARRLGPVAWRLCAAPGYLASGSPLRRPADLAAHPFICPPVAVRRAVLRTAGETVAVVPRLQSEDFCLLRDAVEAGLGVGLLPGYMVDAAVAAGRLVVLLPGVALANAGEAVFLVTTRTSYPSRAQRLVADFLRRSLEPVLAGRG